MTTQYDARVRYKVSQLEALVDKIRHAGTENIQNSYVLELLAMFDRESGSLLLDDSIGKAYITNPMNPFLHIDDEEEYKAKELQIHDLEFTDKDRIYLGVNHLFDVKIVRTDEGIVIDVYPYGVDSDPIATTYAYDNECYDENGIPYYNPPEV